MTHHVDVDQALATLDYREMVALSKMFERWALNEENITDERRTDLIKWSADYEALAAFAGSDWIATDPTEPPSLIVFMARRELASRS
ncbi:MAG: hypothetical protein KF780_11760 [Sphingomonas sp.]|nr:hypothetical protein [Sphingomonas sp.]